MSRGLLILIEGLDRSGKTTQCQRIQSQIPNSHLIRFPDRTTPIGQQIDAYLLSKSLKAPLETMHLLFSANRWETLPTIKSYLDKGETVILDRYVYSGIAYSYVASRPSDGNASLRTPLSLQWLEACDLGLLKPDLFFFLDVSEQVQRDRAGFGEELYEKLEFQRRVADVFHQILPEKGSSGFHIINADQQLDSISTEILDFIKDFKEPGDYNYYEKIARSNE